MSISTSAVNFARNFEYDFFTSEIKCKMAPVPPPPAPAAVLKAHTAYPDPCGAFCATACWCSQPAACSSGADWGQSRTEVCASSACCGGRSWRSTELRLDSIQNTSSLVGARDSKHTACRAHTNLCMILLSIGTRRARGGLWTLACSSAERTTEVRVCGVSFERGRGCGRRGH